MAESMSDYYEQAREVAKIERELEVERWVKIRLVLEPDADRGDRQMLYEYDLPRSVADRYEWVIRWRAAKLQCQNPHGYICKDSCYYRRIMGRAFGMQDDLDRFISAKAQLTRQQRVVDEYRQDKRQENDMFYNETGDELLQKALAKLEAKRLNLAAAEARLIAKVKEYINETNQTK